MKRVKFPKTRRDKFVEHRKQLKEEHEWWKKYFRQREALGRETRANKIKRLFEAESQLPLATNEDSWSEAAFCRAGLPRPWARLQSKQSREEASQTQSLGTQEGNDEVDDFNDEVFLEDLSRSAGAGRPGQLGGVVADGVIGDEWPVAEQEQEPKALGARSGRSSPDVDRGSVRSYAVSWVADDDIETVHTVSEYRHPRSYDYTDTGIVSAANCLDVLAYLWAIGGYLLDVGSDVALAYKYYSLGHTIWFALTLVFVGVPAFCMSVFSLILYIRDHKIVGEKASAPRWLSRAVFLILQLAPLYRAIETCLHACRSCTTSNHEQKAKFYRQMVLEEIDSMLLRLFEAFLEAAPQLVLQLYICTQIGLEEGTGLVVLQIMSLLSSWFTVSWALVAFHRALRRSHYPVRAPMTKAGMAAQFLWRLCTVAARILAFVMFGSAFKGFLFVVVGLHWLLMLTWVCVQHTDYCTLQSSTGKEHHSLCLEVLFRVMAAFVHIFCFFNLIDGHTRLRALFFYVLVYVENGMMVLAWYISGSTVIDAAWYQVPVFVAVFVGFLIGMLFMFVYYVMCHPNQYSDNPRHQKIKPWVKCDDLSLFRDPNAVEHTRSETDNSSVMTQGLQYMPVDTSLPRGYPWQGSAGSLQSKWERAPNNEVIRDSNRLESVEYRSPQNKAHGILPMATAPHVAYDPQSQLLLERPVASASQSQQTVSKGPAYQKQIWPADQHRPATHKEDNAAVQQRPANHLQLHAAVQERPASQRQGTAVAQERPLSQRQDAAVVQDRLTSQSRQVRAREPERPANQTQHGAALPERPASQRQDSAAMHERLASNRLSSLSATVTLQEPSDRKSSRERHLTGDGQSMSTNQKEAKPSRRSISQEPERQPTEQRQAGRPSIQRQKRSGRSSNRRQDLEARKSVRQQETAASDSRPANQNSNQPPGQGKPASQRRDAPSSREGKPRKQRRKRTTGQTKLPNQRWETPNILLASQFQLAQPEAVVSGSREQPQPVSEIKRDGLHLGHQQRTSAQPENHQDGGVEIFYPQPPEAYKITCV